MGGKQGALRSVERRPAPDRRILSAGAGGCHERLAEAKFVFSPPLAGPDPGNWPLGWPPALTFPALDV